MSSQLTVPWTDAIPTSGWIIPTVRVATPDSGWQTPDWDDLEMVKAAAYGDNSDNDNLNVRVEDVIYEQFLVSQALRALQHGLFKVYIPDADREFLKKKPADIHNYGHLQHSIKEANNNLEHIFMELTLEWFEGYMNKIPLYLREQADVLEEKEHELEKKRRRLRLTQEPMEGFVEPEKVSRSEVKAYLESLQFEVPEDVWDSMIAMKKNEYRPWEQDLFLSEDIDM